jgi:type II secretory pathway pseudopilin PulG
MGFRVRSMSRRKGDRLLGRSMGFTLVELVLATLISSLVIGIFSVALSISLRAWERQQNREISDTPSLLELLKRQLAQFNPILIQLDGKQRPMFQGDGQSLAFATDYSVRAISKGVPVIARYVFIPGRGELFYAELPLDPYHPEPIHEFLKMSPGNTKSWPRFYLVEVTEFALSYATKEEGQFTEATEDAGGIPSAVRVDCASRGDSASFSAMIFVNSPFSETSDGKQPAQGGLKSKQFNKRNKRL